MLPEDEIKLAPVPPAARPQPKSKPVRRDPDSDFVSELNPDFNLPPTETATEPTSEDKIVKAVHARIKVECAEAIEILNTAVGKFHAHSFELDLSGLLPGAAAVRIREFDVKISNSLSRAEVESLLECRARMAAIPDSAGQYAVRALADSFAKIAAPLLEVQNQIESVGKKILAESSSGRAEIFC